MNDLIEPGDICVIQHATYHLQYNGSECVVLAGLAFRTALLPGGLQDEPRLRYAVRMSDGKALWPLAHQLRKKRPPETPESVTRTAVKTDEVTA